jgi:hypothetical protein
LQGQTPLRLDHLAQLQIALQPSNAALSEDARSEDCKMEKSKVDENHNPQTALQKTVQGLQLEY